MLFFAIISCLVLSTVSAVAPIQGTQCTPNQVINRLTVHESGALEAECGPVPCGQAGLRCLPDQTACRADTDVFSGMRWAANGQSVLMRCCTLKVPSKVYVGTDLVTAGAYYQGGTVAEADLSAKGNREYDYIANVRTEQGGVRVWVYRIVCAPGDEVVPMPVSATTAEPVAARKSIEKELDENQNEEEDEEEEESDDTEDETVAEQNDETPTVVEQEAAPFNPLRYRPSQVQRASTGVRRA